MVLACLWRRLIVANLPPTRSRADSQTQARSFRSIFNLTCEAMRLGLPCILQGNTIFTGSAHRCPSRRSVPRNATPESALEQQQA
jgi:hypothetical protein